MQLIEINPEIECTLENKAYWETEIGVLDGVEDVNFQINTGRLSIKFDENKISERTLKEFLGRFDKVKDSPKNKSVVKEAIYYVQGMHCASCEVLIEKTLLKKNNIKSADASTAAGRVVVEYQDNQPSLNELNRIFKGDHYTFFDHPVKAAAQEPTGGLFKNFFWAAVIIVLFLLLNRTGFSSLVNVTSSSSLPAFFVLGILAGLSTCAALVGGLVLSMSKQWLSLYSVKATWLEKMQPHLMFNAGRIISYGLFGALLGAIGSKLQISLGFSSALVVLVSFLMLFLGLQMLGFKAFRNFQIAMPKFITRRVADETKFQGKQMPFLMGALTFFLPCGFTITAQGMALLSGSAWQGSMIMLLFALGAAPPLLAIGFSSVKFSARPHLSAKFLKTAGALVLFFALFNINSQMNVLGLPSITDLLSNKSSVSAVEINDKDLPPIVNGKQLVKMEASSVGYSPDHFKVRAGVPVRWEIKDTGTSGCTNAILARGLFPDQIDLTPGQTAVKEFTPQKVGRYKFSCWMGMINGVIEVVDGNSKSSSFNFTGGADAASTVPSGATGCGCGGDGSGSCAVNP